jgi:Protein of unknown function (DUF3788)
VDNPNAFIGKKEEPTAEDISAALGSSAKAWDQLVEELAQQHGVNIQEWKSYSPKYGWSMKLKLKKRTIVHLGPCKGYFQVAFILGDKAVQAALQSNLSKSTRKAIQEAPRYPEGTGVRFLVKGPKDLAAVRKLAVIKLAS